MLKANGQEGLRLTADGKIKIWGNDTVTGVLYRDEFGVVKGGGMSTALGEVMGISSTGPCTGGEGEGVPYWRVHGNDFTYLCDEDPRPLLGTLNFEDLPFHTNGVERMRITKNGLITTRGTAGTETVRIQGDGKVKIGTTADAGLLNVGGALMVGTTASEGLLNVGGSLLIRDGTDGDIVTSSSASTGPVLWARNNQAAWGLSIDQNGKGHILGDWNNPHPIMTFAYDKVGIGTEDMPNDEYSLFVGKGILTEKVKVALRNTSEWSDHVFLPNYRLMPLKEVDTFIKEHGHLPGVPSAAQMVESGLDVVKTDAMLMEKIEVITLHLIAMEKQIQGLQQENLDLQRRLLKH
ncbi:MAG TPA: hypothetical protein PLL18_11065 [Flavobacteriales bacterium]|nr:hypothetical protein [Flavobacteriales bacterium]